MRHAADVAPSMGLVSVDHSSLSKRFKDLDYRIVKRIFEVIVQKLNRSARRSLGMKKELLSIDSTTITVGKTHLPWALYYGERSGIKLHVSLTNETTMPLKIVETTGLKHDGPIGEKLVDKRFILVCDRAYFSIDKVDRYQIDKQDFVIRLKENIQLNRKNRSKRLISPNAVFNQLFAALIAYVLLKFLHENGQKKNHRKPLSFEGFTRLLLCDALPFEW